MPKSQFLALAIKDRYSTQVGNVVAVPVSLVLGYALGLAFQRVSGDESLLNLHQRFPNIEPKISSKSSKDNS